MWLERKMVLSSMIASSLVGYMVFPFTNMCLVRWDYGPIGWKPQREVFGSHPAPPCLIQIFPFTYILPYILPPEFTVYRFSPVTAKTVQAFGKVWKDSIMNESGFFLFFFCSCKPGSFTYHKSWHVVRGPVHFHPCYGFSPQGMGALQGVFLGSACSIVGFRATKPLFPQHIRMFSIFQAQYRYETQVK